MPEAVVRGIHINYEVIGSSGPWIALTPGSRRAFGKSARDLSRTQAGLLAAVLPSPAKRDAHAPGPGLRRLAGLYVGRSARSPEAAICVR